MNKQEIKQSLINGLKLIDSGYSERGLSVLWSLYDRLEDELEYTIPLMKSDPTNIVEFKISKLTNGCIKDR